MFDELKRKCCSYLALFPANESFLSISFFHFFIDG